MSRTNTNGSAASAAATQIVQRARQAAEAAKPVAAQVKPFADDAREARALTSVAARNSADRPGRTRT